MDKGKGKGKLGRLKPKTPEELHFEGSGGRLWLRAARNRGGLPAASDVEIGNLDEDKASARLLGPIPQGVASVEVLCNRQSILGNPFDMKKREELRAPVLDAYTEFLQIILSGASRVDIEGLALKRGMTR